MKDDEFQLARIEELHGRAKCNKKLAFSDVFSYSELVKIGRSLAKSIRSDAILYGGYPEAERKCFFFLGEKTSQEEFEEEGLYGEVIHCFLIEQRSPRYASPLTHSAVLGKLMSLGIKREMLGDIIVKDDKAVIFALAKVESEILSVEDVGRDNVGIKRIEYGQSPIKMEFETRRITYESNRLDAILSCAFRMSREEAKEAIESGLVFLTSSSAPKPSSPVEEGDHISMKGKGKAIFLSEVGISKKGKTVDEIKLPK